MFDLATTTYVIFGALAILCFLLHGRVDQTKSNVAAAASADFLQLQRRYFVPYFFALFSDWLQGPYVYKLYSSYGFKESEIAVLYVVGFASSAVFGTFTGVLADRCGRRKTSLVFCVSYIVCCLTKMSPNFYVLLIGRALGGVATSMLFSTFESWYIYEHVERRKFSMDWLSITFSRSTFWNGVLAIVAGILANLAAETIGWGPVAPFIMAVPVLLVALVLISTYWEENYGERHDGLTRTCVGGLRDIFGDSRVLLLGVVQTLFESVMYMFVFVWTPILDSSHGAVDDAAAVAAATGSAKVGAPLGMIFACFMVCVMIGSLVTQMAAAESRSHETVLIGAVMLALIAMTMCFVATLGGATDTALAYVGFLLLEVAVGAYFPTVGVLRGRVVPEAHRAGVMNWFRLPMNGMTCAGLYWLHNENNENGNHQIFTVCVVMLVAASLAAVEFARRMKQRALLSTKSIDDELQMDSLI